MGRLFNELVTAGTGLGLKDTQCGFKAFRTPVARLLFHLVRIDRFAFDVEILARARRLGLAITEVPVHWKHVEGSTVHPLHDSWTMVADVLRSRRGLLGGPPVPTVTIRPGRSTDPAGPAASPPGGRAARARSSTAPRSRWCADGAGVTALLALVEPADVARAHAALRDGWPRADVTRRDLGSTAWPALGPLPDASTAGAGRRDPRPRRIPARHAPGYDPPRERGPGWTTGTAPAGGAPRRRRPHRGHRGARRRRGRRPTADTVTPDRPPS